VVVVQAIPKGDRGELAVEMLTEVGVDRIVPWAASRCVAVWKGERAEKALAKWRATAREAAKQARRSWFPEVGDVVGTDEELAAFSAVGAEPVRLGSSVLRTSTAGVAATAALLARTRWK
jgi:16S rRNA (uracil1498-N3)-methyltransferase